ncbi:hypothetical protein MMC07_003880 [Pseudocyphellaria aurata]|nr:hypothetical protein [Pseudocyphellaria aurata]
MSGEFAGTFLFLFFAFSGTQVANAQKFVGSTTEAQGPDPSQLMYISLCFGFSLAVNAWVFFRISGGLFNPAVTLGMFLVGALSWSRAALLVVSQILGGIAAAGVVLVLFPGPLNVQTSLGGGTTVTQGLFIEMFLTAQLVFTIFMLATEKHKGTFIAPVGIGLSLFISELTGVYYTGGAVNPARAFGPCVVLHSFYSYHWIYWLGPILGTLLASGFYRFIKMLEYETANPGQDMDEKEKRTFNHRAANSSTVDFTPAEAPTVPNHRPESFDDRFTDGNCSTANVQHAGGSSSGSAGHPSRLSAAKGSRQVSDSPSWPQSESFGQIYIDASGSYQSAPDIEAARQVPRTAGRS